MKTNQISLANKIYLILAGLFITSLVASNLIFTKIFYWYPFDINFLTKYFIRHWKPKLAIFIDSEIWPNISEKKDFVVSSSSLKDVRSFSREVFSKVNLNQDLKDELVLAIAEAAQNIVKHAYQNQETDDKMEIKISLDNGELEIGFFDKGRPVDNSNVRHRKIDDVKPGGLGTFFIKQIMDAVVFKEGEKPWINHLILTKKINY